MSRTKIGTGEVRVGWFAFGRTPSRSWDREHRTRTSVPLESEVRFVRKWRQLGLFLLIVLIAGAGRTTGAEPSKSKTCQEVVRELNQVLREKIDEEELVSVLRKLNETRNRSLPAKFVMKNQARKMGWRPGKDLWDSEGLVGKSLGGDVFSNREGRLPDGRRVWREADLDYKGGRRGPKRLIYSDDGLRSVTVNHYNTFKALPPCE